MATIDSIMPILNGFGLTPQQLTPERMDKLQKLAENFGEADSITPEVVSEITKIFGIRAPEKAKPKMIDVKVGRNEPCPCESGIKYKKCCGK